MQSGGLKLVELLPLSNVTWKPCYRIIPSKFPPIQLFEEVAEPGDLEAIFELESLTNDRLRNEIGELQLIPPEDRISGPNTNYIMASFTHLAPQGSRFSDGSYGVYYAAKSLETSIAETRYHRANFLRATREEPGSIDMRVITARLSGQLHDIRTLDAPDIYNPNHYHASQIFAKQLRAAKSWGICYRSVRHAEGECVAVFRPPILKDCKQTLHLSYIWDGNTISHVIEKRLVAA